MKNTTLLMGIGFFAVIAGILIFANSSTTTAGSNFLGQKITGSVINSAYTGEAQVVKMYVEGGNYILEPSSVKEGIPVRIEADVTRMPGCSKAVVIPAFNIAENLNSQNNVIEFTPDKSGTFNIMCSMNMYRGTFTVLKADGSKSNYVEQAQTGGSSCGASGGGCGCGAR